MQATAATSGIAVRPRFETVCEDGVPVPQSNQPLQRTVTTARMISPAWRR